MVGFPRLIHGYFLWGTVYHPAVEDPQVPVDCLLSLRGQKQGNSPFPSLPLLLPVVVWCGAGAEEEREPSLVEQDTWARRPRAADGTVLAALRAAGSCNVGSVAGG